MNTEKLIKLLTEHCHLLPELIFDLEGRLKEEYYKTHQILHAAGQQENRIYFLKKGLIRNYYYDHHGNQHTVRFWEANPGTLLDCVTTMPGTRPSSAAKTLVTGCCSISAAVTVDTFPVLKRFVVCP